MKVFKNPINRRLRKFFFRRSSESLLEIYYNILHKWDNFTKTEYERLLMAEAEFALQVCPASVVSTDDGEGLEINKYRKSKIFAIANLPHENPEEIGIRKNTNPAVVDKIYEIANDKHIDLTYTQILYKMSPAEENKERNKELTFLEVLRNTQIKFFGRYNKWFDHQAEDIEKASKMTFDGTHRQFKQLLLARVDSSSVEDTEFHVDHMMQELRGHGVNTEVLYGAQMRGLKASIMSNELMLDWASKVMSNTAAMMWPGKKPIKYLDEKGVLIGYLDAGKDAGIPLYLDIGNKKLYNNNNFAVLGGSGSGKTTMFLNILKNAIAAGMDFCHFFPKQDFGTDAIEFITKLKGNFVCVGPRGKGIYPFKIIWNPDTQGDNTDSMYSAYIRTKEAVLYFFYMLIGSAFSSPMQAVFKSATSAFYIQEKYMDEDGNPINPEKWKDPKEIPRIRDFVSLLRSWSVDDDPEHIRARSSIRALLGYMIDFEKGQSLHWMDPDPDESQGEEGNEIDITGRFTMFDLSEIPTKYQDAITVFLIGMVNSKIKNLSKDAMKKKNRCIISFDEGPRILQTPAMAEYLPTLLREIRSSGNSLFINGQDIQGMKPILPVIKSNTDAIIFMCGMEKADINELATQFPLDDDDRAILSRPGKGRFYFYKENRRVSGRVVPLATERKVFFGETVEDESELSLSVEDYSEPEYELIDEMLRYVVDNFGVLNKNWIKSQKDIEISGFTKNTKVSPVADYLSKVNYLSNDIAKLDKINGESPDHWITKCLLGGEAILAGCKDVVINTWGDQGGDEDPDVTCITPSGKRLGLEYARAGSRSIGQLRKQKNNHLKYCDIWRCVCQQKNEPEVRAAVNESNVKSAVGEDFCLPRGEEVGIFFKHLKEENEINIKTELEKLENEDKLELEKEVKYREEKSSFTQEDDYNGERSYLEDGEAAATDGTLTEGVA